MSATTAAIRIDAMTLTVALFLISTLAAVGLDALAASLAPGDWFKRTLAFLASPALLLLVPAYEPFLALTVQGATVATGVAVWRLLRARKLVKQADPTRPSATESAPTRRVLRFGIATLLRVMAICVIVAAVLAQLPEQNRESWQSIASVGVAGGLATLLGAWAALKRWWSIAPALALAVLVGVGPALLDWFAIAIITSGWPPDPSILASMYSIDADPQYIWLALIPATTLAVFPVVMLGGFALSSVTRQGGRHAAGALMAALAIIVAAPASLVLLTMLIPEPIPRVQLPQPNGYDELVAAGRVSENTLASSYSFDAYTAKQSDLELAAREAETAIAQARAAFDRECRVPVDYMSKDIPSMESIRVLRSLARVMAATGQLHAVRGEMDQSLSAYLDTIQVGVECRRGGLLIDGIIGIAVARTGYDGLCHHVDQLSPEQCRAAIVRLRELQSDCEPFESFYRRDRIWSAYANGWSGRICQILNDIETIEYEDSFLGILSEDHSVPFKAVDAYVELLVAELSLRAFTVEQGRVPAGWDEVVAAGGAALGVDPFDPGGGTLRYLIADGKPVIYSLGQNRLDDGGDAISISDPGWDPEVGDLRLDKRHIGGPAKGTATMTSAPQGADAAVVDEVDAVEADDSEH
jgi:hypothetical protein